MMDLDGDPWASGSGAGHDVGSSHLPQPRGSSTNTGHNVAGVIQAQALATSRPRILPLFLPTTRARATSNNLPSLKPPVPPASKDSKAASAAVAPVCALCGNMEYVKRPIRAATAPAAQRVYLNTFLFVTTSLALLLIAAVAYPVFYYTYVPRKVITVPVHLQYNAGLNPFGVVSLSKNLMLETAYDVSVELTLPRSPPNVNRGNFMVSLFATKSEIENPAQSWTLPSDPYAHVDISNVVFSSRRPALVPYSDPIVSYASRALFLLWHIFVPTSEQVTLEIAMGELVEFKTELPLSILLDVQAGQTFQVYSAKIELIARLTGARWAMYNHRILSFVVCTTFFWFAEMLSMGLVWLFLAHCFGGRKSDDTALISAMDKNKGHADQDYTKHEVALRGGSKTDAGSASASGTDSLTTSGAKYEAEEDRKIKEESKERDSPLDSPRRAGDAENGESTGARYDEGTGVIRRRSSQMDIL